MNADREKRSPPPAGEERPPFAILAEWIVAPVRLALLELAIELELPDIIASTGRLPDIAARLGVSCRDRLGYILDAMAAAGLLHKENGEYRNTALADSYLRKERPTFLGGLVIGLKRMQLRNIGHLKEVLFADIFPVAASDRLHDEEHWKNTGNSLAAYQKAGVADSMAAIAVGLPGAERFRSMLDLGCGPGIIGLRILERLPELHLTLCDFPHMLQLAEQETVAAGMSGKVTFMPGDYNKIDWGQDYDLIWSCQSLYYAEDVPRFLKRIFASLSPGGFFVSIHEGVRCEKTEPAVLILSRLSLALEGQDVSFVRGSIAAAAKEAGFHPAHTASLPMLYGDADLEVFLKPLQ